MSMLSRIRALLKWGFTAATVLLLLGMALAPWPEARVTKAVSLQMADGFLTIRTWGTAGGSSQGIPSDDPEKHPRGIPDTRNLSLGILLVVLAVPMAILWGSDRRYAVRGLCASPP